MYHVLSSVHKSSHNQLQIVMVNTLSFSVSSDKEEPRLLQSLAYLNQQLNEYYVIETDKGKAFLEENLNYTAIDYIIANFCE